MQRTTSGFRAMVSVRTFVACICMAVLACVEAAPPPFILDVPDGGMLPGTFAPVAGSEGEPRTTFRWQSPAFVDPFEFRLDAVTGIRAAASVPAREEPTGFRCRLRGGDILDGTLDAIDAKVVSFKPVGNDTPVRIDRSIVSSIRRRGSRDGIGYVGPGGVVGWQQEPADSWREEAARLTSARRNAKIARDLHEPVRARYDIVLSWQETPDFVIAVGAGDAKAGEPYRFELMELAGGGRAGWIVRQDRQGKTSGSLEEVPLPPLDQGRLRMSLFVDAVAGRLAVAMEGHDQIVETTVAPAGPPSGSGLFRLTLLSGDVCLESIRVTAWTSPDPTAEDHSDGAVRTRDGGVVQGTVESLDAAADTIVMAGGGAPESLSIEKIESIEFAGGDNEEAAADTTFTIRVVQHDGGILTGHLLLTTPTAIEVGRPGIAGTVVVPMKDIRAVTSLQALQPQPLPARLGVLAIDDARIPGCLVDGAAWGGIAWMPKGSLGASGLRGASDAKGVAAEVVYVAARKAADREVRNGQVEIGGVGASISVIDDGSFVVSMLVEDGAAARDGRVEPGDRIRAVRATREGPFVETKGIDLETVMNLLRGRVGTPVDIRIETADGQVRTVNLVRRLIYLADRDVLDRALATHDRVAPEASLRVTGYPAIVALRSGDVVPAVIDRIDAKGVTLRSPMTADGGRAAVVVSDDLVKAVELDPSASTQGIPRERFERLLTVPRSQRPDPPTHLLRLRTGDYLRGKLVSLDPDTVTFDVLGQRKTLPRQSVIRLIWLHPEHLMDEDAKAGKKDAAGHQEVRKHGALLVQGLASGGERTTLEVERVDRTSVIGRSPAFGPTQIDTTRIDRLLVGTAIAESKDDLPFAKWKLRLAPPPRALRDTK